MIMYLVNKIKTKFTSDKKLLDIAEKLRNSIIKNNCRIETAKSLMISEIKNIQVIGGKRFVKFIGKNNSNKYFEILICDTGVISMSKNDSMLKHFDHYKYSLYIKEI